MHLYYHTPFSYDRKVQPAQLLVHFCSAASQSTSFTCWALALRIALLCPLSPIACPQSTCFARDQKAACESIPQLAPQCHTWKACTALNADMTTSFPKSSVVLFCLFRVKGNRAQSRHVAASSINLSQPPCSLQLCWSLTSHKSSSKSVGSECDQEEMWYWGSWPFLTTSTSTSAFSFFVFLLGPSHSQFPGLKILPLFTHLTAVFLSFWADTLLYTSSTKAAGAEQQDRKGRYRSVISSSSSMLPVTTGGTWSIIVTLHQIFRVLSWWVARSGSQQGRPGFWGCFCHKSSVKMCKQVWG